MVSEQTRLQSSAAISMSFHGMVFGLYLLLRTTTVRDQLVLTRVEFLDLKPASVETPASGSAERAPRNLREFLRMALPRFKPASQTPQEAQPMEAPQEQMLRAQDARIAPKLRIDDSKTLQHAASIRLQGPQLATGQQASFSDIASSAQRRPSDLAAVDVKPDLQLEAIGRKSVRGAAGGSIRINPNAGAPRPAGFRDIVVGALQTAGRGTGGQAGAQPGIRLVDEGGPTRPGRLPPPAIGYGKGGGLSLKEQALARPASAKLSDEQAARRTQADTPVLKVNGNKAVEIIGPLAKRKVITMSLPRYPDWAKEKGLEAEVSIRFFVSLDGRVRERVLLERTSGYEELDRLCMEEIKKWVFVALEQSKEEGDQWGVITFRFRLK